MEDRVDGSDWFADFARTGAMVLSSQRNADALAVHAEHGLVRRESEGMAGAKCIAEAAKDFGVTDDRVRLALSLRGVARGKKGQRLECCAEIGATRASSTRKIARARPSPAIETRMRESTAEFHAMQITQRPTFVVDTEIGDRAIFSGVVKFEPIAATIDRMLDDATATPRIRRTSAIAAGEMSVLRGR